MSETKRVIAEHRIFDPRRSCSCELCRINKRIERLSSRWNKSTREIVEELVDLWVNSVNNNNGLTNAISVIQEADRVAKEGHLVFDDSKDQGPPGA